MSLGIVDSFVFEVSKLLVTVFDELEYRSAKRASLRAARKPANATLKHSQEQSSLRELCSGYNLRVNLPSDLDQPQATTEM